MKCSMLTTIDNPYDPFEDFDKWFLFDISKGYDSCGYLARVAHASDAFSEPEYFEEVERAIDEIIKLDPFNVYRKVSKDFEDSLEVADFEENS